MKKLFVSIALACLLFLVMATESFSQEIYFCQGVDENGNPQNSSDTFYLDSEGEAEVVVLVMLDEPVGCNSIDYDIYEFWDISLDLEYLTTIKQENIGLNWVYFWKKIIFKEQGVYWIEVKDCNSKVLIGDVLIVAKVAD